MAHALVTGGAGFVGSHIVERLLADGLQVTVLDDLSSGLKENLPSKAELIVGDIRTPEARRVLIDRRPDFIVHAAAQISVRISMDDPVLDGETNVVGLLNLLSACRDSYHPHFVFISTGGAIYGEQDNFPASEDHPVRPTSVYGLSKRVSELYLELWERQFELPFVALRLANVYGPRQNPHGEAGVVAIFNERLLRGDVATIFGDGKQTRDFVFVKDVADAVGRVVQKRIKGIYNIGTGVETTVNDLYKFICQSLGVSKAANPGPERLGEQLRSCVDSRKAKKTFGWEPSVSIQEGLKVTSDWFRSKSSRV